MEEGWGIDGRRENGEGVVVRLEDVGLEWEGVWGVGCGKGR